MKFVSKEAENSNIVAAILNSTQQPGRVLVTSFRLRDFVSMALTTTLAYGCSWAELLWPKHTPNTEIIALRIVKRPWVDNRLGKIDFADPVKDANDDLFFSFLLICRVERNYVTFTWPRCQDSFKIAAPKVASFGTNFVRITDTSEVRWVEKLTVYLFLVKTKK